MWEKTDQDRCPAATGRPQADAACLITGSEHQCMRLDTVHPIHTCWCGTQWCSSESEAAKLSKAPGANALTWIDDHGSVWIAPVGTPPPADPMPVAWQKVS